MTQNADIPMISRNCWQHYAQRKATVFKLLVGRFWGFFSPSRGDTLYRWGKFGVEEGTIGPTASCQTSPPLVQRQGYGTPKKQNFNTILLNFGI